MGSGLSLEKGEIRERGRDNGRVSYWAMKYTSHKRDKERGEWVEMQFMARAAAQGMIVSRPWGDSARYDFAVDCQGHFQRVQVKSTSAKHPSGYYVCKITRGGVRLRKGRKYTPEQIDYFACYVIPEEAWYIIPVRKVVRIKAAIHLSPRHPRNRFFPYLEAWHLLKKGLGASG